MSKRSPKSFIAAANQPSFTPCQLTSGPMTSALGFAARIAARAITVSVRYVRRSAPSRYTSRFGSFQSE